MFRSLSMFLLVAFPLALRAELNLEDVFGNKKPTEGGIIVPKADDKTHTQKQEKKPDVFTLLTGDRFSGTLIEMTPEKGMVWKHENVVAPINFTLGNLKDIQLGTFAERKSPEPSVEVGLTNGDSLRGSIVSLQDQSLKLKTSYGDILDIRLPMVRTLRHASAEQTLVYSGPNSLEEWTRGNNRDCWVFRNNALYSDKDNGSIGINVKDLPRKIRIDFDLAWKANLQLNLCVFAEKLDNFYGPGYQLSLQNNYVSLNRRSRNNSHGLGGHHVPQLSSKRQGKFSLCLNLVEKSIILLRDEKVVKRWDDSAEFEGKGEGIIFYVGNGRHRLRDIHISPWDGKLKTEKKDEEEAVEDTIRFGNGDKLTGKLLRIVNQEVFLKTEYAELNIPLKRMSLLQLAESERQRARRNGEDLRATFASGGTVTLKLSSLDAESLKGESENFGKVVFKRDAFIGLEYNLYDERGKESEEDDW